jgi:hypothetical protein
MLFSKVKWSKGQSYMNLLGSADRYKYVIRCMFPFVGVSCFIENSMRCFNFCMFVPIYAGNALCTDLATKINYRKWLTLFPFRFYYFYHYLHLNT